MRTRIGTSAVSKFTQSPSAPLTDSLNELVLPATESPGQLSVLRHSDTRRRGLTRQFTFACAAESLRVEATCGMPSPIERPRVTDGRDRPRPIQPVNHQTTVRVRPCAVMTHAGAPARADRPVGSEPAPRPRLRINCHQASACNPESEGFEFYDSYMAEAPVASTLTAAAACSVEARGASSEVGRLRPGRHLISLATAAAGSRTARQYRPAARACMPHIFFFWFGHSF